MPTPTSKGSNAPTSRGTSGSRSKASCSRTARSLPARSAEAIDIMRAHAPLKTAAAIAIVFAASALRADAQQTVGDVLTFLVTNQGVATGNPQIDRAAAQATSETISRALLANVATLPVTSSSGAFVYQLNPELGTVERATESFGPFFVERASTAGRGETSFALTFQHLHFAALDGHDLRDGTFVTTANKFREDRK